MSTKNIVIDLDNTILPFSYYAYKLYPDKFHWDPVSYKWNISKDEILQVHKVQLQNPIPKSVLEFLKTLEKYKVYFVSARDKSIYKDTLQYLKDYITFLDFQFDLIDPIKRVDFAKKLDAYLIDDNPITLQYALKTYPKVIATTWRYNRYLLPHIPFKIFVTPDFMIYVPNFQNLPK